MFSQVSVNTNECLRLRRTIQPKNWLGKTNANGELGERSLKRPTKTQAFSSTESATSATIRIKFTLRLKNNIKKPTIDFHLNRGFLNIFFIFTKCLLRVKMNLSKKEN